MFPIIFIVITSIFIYRTARDNGYNAVLWTVAAVSGFIVIQVAIGLFAGVLLGIGMALWDWPSTLFEDYAFLIGLVSLIPSVGFILIIWKYVNRIRDDHTPTKKSSTTIYGGDE